MPEIVLLTLKETAARLRCSVSKVQQLCLAGDLTFLPGRPLLVPEEALNAYISGNLKFGTKSSCSTIVDNRSDEDRAFDELGITLEGIAKRNGYKMRMTPEIAKLMEPFKNHPRTIEMRRQATIAWHTMKQREAALAEKKAAIREKAMQEEQRQAAADRRKLAVEIRKLKKANQPKTS